MSERVRDIEWWYWLAVTGLLLTGLLYWEPAFAVLHLVCGARTLQLAIAERSLNAFSVQVNTVFLALVVATNLVAPEGLLSVALILAGARAVTGYCVIARLLTLLPMHRREPWSWDLLKRTLGAPPRHGVVLDVPVHRSNIARA